MKDEVKMKFVGIHGADDTPVEEGTRPNPGQLLAKILYGDEDTRLKICARMLQADSDSHRCMEQGHITELEFRRHHIVRLQQQVNALQKQLVTKLDEWIAEKKEKIVGTAVADIKRGELGQVIIESKQGNQEQDQDGTPDQDQRT